MRSVVFVSMAGESSPAMFFILREGWLQTKGTILCRTRFLQIVKGNFHRVGSKLEWMKILLICQIIQAYSH